VAWWHAFLFLGSCVVGALVGMALRSSSREAVLTTAALFLLCASVMIWVWVASGRKLWASLPLLEVLGIVLGTVIGYLLFTAA